MTAELPKTYRKLEVVEPGTDFARATRIVEVPMPSPGPGELLMRNRFAGVNASDPIFAAGGYGNTATPFDIGIESAGEVVAVGAGVAHLKPGDAVMKFGFGGGYAEYRLVKAAEAIPVAAASAAAVSVLIAGLTASIGLEVGELRAGDVVLVTAAAGGVGSYAVQLAQQAGARVVGTCGSEDKAQWLRRHGCERVIDYRREDLATVLAREYPQGIDLVFENVGRRLFDTAVSHLAVFGRVVCIGAVSEYQGGMQWEAVSQVRIYQQLLAKSALVRGFFLPHYPQRFAAHLEKLFGLIAQGAIEAPVDPREFTGIDAVRAAVAHLQGGANLGKVVVRF